MHPIKMDYQSILFYYEEEVTLTYNTENASYENGLSVHFTYIQVFVFMPFQRMDSLEQQTEG